MAVFAQEDNRTTDTLHPVVCLTQTALEACHNGAGGIDKPNAQLLGTAIGARWLTVGTDKQVATRKVGHIIVTYGL